MSEWRQWELDDNGRWRCPRHPHVSPTTGLSHITTRAPIEACGECWREVHVCPLPDDIVWPDYWRDVSNAFAPSYFDGRDLQPPVYSCAFHGDHDSRVFMAHEACRHCVEEDADAQ